MLNEWLQHGIYFSKTQLGTSWDQTFDGWAPNCFLFFPENADRFLVGVIQPSKDKGLRKYPFLVSTVIDRRRFHDDFVYLTPMIFSRFFNDARQLMSSASQGLGVQSVIDQTQAMNVEVDDHATEEADGYARFLADTTLEQFFVNVFGSFDDARKYLLFKNLTEILLPFRQRNLARLTLGVRFPLSREQNASGLEVCFWTQVCFAMLDTRSITPTLFWGTPEGEKGSHLFAYFHQPSPKGFLHLLRPDMNGDNMCLLDEEGRDKLASTAQSMSQRQRALLDSRTMTLKSFLEQLA